MVEPGIWRPLVDGKLREQSIRVAREIAAALINPIQPPLPPGLPEEYRRAREAHLGGGNAGVALLHAELAVLGEGDVHKVHAQALLEDCFDAVAEAPMGPALYGGFTGIAWTASHLDRRLFKFEEDPAGEIDEAMLTLLANPWDADYDLVSGLVGFGVYALERLPRPDAVRMLELVLAQLEARHVEMDEGWSWHTSPAWIGEEAAKEFPGGYYNSGLAHGVPAVTSLAAHALAAGVDAERARRLIDKSVAWLLSTQAPQPSHTRFPSMIDMEGRPTPSRAAWCYGDPGAVLGLLAAAKATRDSALESEALDIARRVASIKDEATGVRDMGLCHGSAGLAHIYNRIYQATGDEVLRDAAVHWIERTLDMRRPGEEVAGYPCWQVQPDGHWEADPGLINGAAGVGLVMLSAATDVAPEWDRSMLISIPAGGE